MISRARIDGSSIYDNWEKLVDAVIKREDYRELCRSQSSDSIDFTPDDDLNPAELEVEEISTLITERLWKEQHEPAVDSANVAATNETAVARRKSRFSIFGRKKEVTNRRKEPRILEENRRPEAKIVEENRRPEAKIVEENRRPEPKIAEERASFIDPAIVDDIIRRLLEVRGSGVVKLAQLSEADIRQLCIASREIFLTQPNLLELDGPLKICGVIDGQDTDLLRLFEKGGFPPDSNYLFLGDYVDRGKQSLETICLLLAYKIKYPENFFLVRGIKYPENFFLVRENHEFASLKRFHDECMHRYNVRLWNVRLWQVFADCFNCLPVAALIDGKILCMHGGLSPDLHDLDQIRNLSRPTDVPDSGLQVSYVFGANQVTEFLQIHELDFVCRLHQGRLHDCLPMGAKYLYKLRI